MRGSLVKTKLGLLGDSLPGSRGAEKRDIYLFINGELWRIYCARDDGECVLWEWEEKADCTQKCLTAYKQISPFECQTGQVQTAM